MPSESKRDENTLSTNGNVLGEKRGGEGSFPRFGGIPFFVYREDGTVEAEDAKGGTVVVVVLDHVILIWCVGSMLSCVDLMLWNIC